MNRLGLIAAFVALLSLGGAQAQSPVLPGPGLTVSSASPPSYVAGPAVPTQNVGFASGTITFNNLNGGVSYPAGAVAWVGVAQDQGTSPFTSPTIGGVTATLVPQTHGANDNLQVYYVSLPSGGADTLTLSSPGGANHVGVAGGYFLNVNPTPNASSRIDYPNGGQPVSVTTPASSINVPAGGFGVAFLGAFNAALTGTNTATWTSTTSSSGDVTSPTTLTSQIVTAHTATASGSWSPTVSGSPTSYGFIAGMAVMSWGP